MIDHGTGVVIGETSVVEDNVSIFQGVTLGGTGKEDGDRHPKVREGVLLMHHLLYWGMLKLEKMRKSLLEVSYLKMLENILQSLVFQLKKLVKQERRDQLMM